MTNEQKRKQLTAMFGAYSKRLESLYDKFIDRLTTLAHKSGVGVEELLGKNVLYRFGNYPELRAEYNEIFKDYVQKEVLAYSAGITDGVALAYAHDASVLSGFSVLSNNAITTARNVAAETFIRNRMKPAAGLSLSQLVLNYASQTKSEFEVAVSNVLADGLKKGTSAASLGLQVRQYLNNPDMMYRRYHRTIVDANGNKKDVVKWRRRVVDDDGRVRFVEEPLEKVGMGHYRSSKRNADRLMRTEINGAYHRANAERWQLEPFVIGIMIELSPQHPEYDECDELKGRYPKDFIFTGWHPQCLCMSNPITIQGEEKKEFYRRLAAGEDMSNYESPNAVKDIPDDAKAWIDANREKFIRAGERGKLGWIWRDNTKYWQGRFSREELAQMGYAPKRSKRIKTEEEKADIQARWNKRRADNSFKEEVKTLYNEVRQVPFFERALMDEIATAYKANDIEKLRKAWPVFSKRARYELSITPKELYDRFVSGIEGYDYMKIKSWSKNWGMENASMRQKLFLDEARDGRNSKFLRTYAEKEVRRATDELARQKSIKEFLEMSDTLRKYGVKYTHPIEFQELIDLPLMQKEVARIKPAFDLGKRIDVIETFVKGMNESNMAASKIGKLFGGITNDIALHGLRPYSQGLLDMVASAEKEIVRLEKEALARSLKSGKLVEGQYIVKLEKINLSEFGWKSVDDVDIEKVLQKLFGVNDVLYNGTFDKLTIRDGSAFMAHNNHSWFDTAKVGEAKHEFIIYTRTHPTSGNFNALKDLKRALYKIAKKESLTFNEEYAIESLWHEIMHGRAKGWAWEEGKNLSHMEGAWRDSMETINQFLARRSYDNLMRALGGVAKHSEEIYAKGYGYGSYVRRFNEVLEYYEIKPAEVVEYFKASLLEKPYQDVREELYEFLSSKIGTKTGVKSLIDSMYKYDSDFRNEFSKMKARSGRP